MSNSSTPRTGHFPQTPIKWSDGTLFNGYYLVAFIPAVGYSEIDLGLIDPTEKLPQFARCPISNGIPNSSLGLYFNADISPPGTTYTASLYDTTNKLIGGPSGTFTVTTDPFTIPSLTLFVPSPGGTAPTPDSGWDVVPGPLPPIINMRTIIITGAKTGTNGSDGNAIFTLNVTPGYLVMVADGQVLDPSLSYTLVGNVVTFLSPHIPLVNTDLFAFGQF